MESVIGSPIKLDPLHILDYRREGSSSFVPVLASKFTKRVFLKSLRAMEGSHSLKSIASSAQPLEASRKLPSREVLEVFRNADAVCFDVDSTVCLDEGIDELADFCGAGEAVAEWTTR
ncbi:hypothetical protein M569_10485, partial [Genlisea aurea]